MESCIGKDDSRIKWIDSARGMAMLSVILGHMNVGSLDYVIFSFHMPFFFLIAGYFFRPQECIPFTRKKARQMLIPYAFTAIVVIAIKLMKNFLKVLSGRVDVQPEGTVLVQWLKAALLGSGGRTDYLFVHSDVSIGAIWFLLAMFLALITFNVLLRSRWIAVYVVLITMLGVISARYFWLPFSVQSAALAVVFVYVGYVFRGEKLQRVVDDRRIVIISAVIWCLYLALCFATKSRLSMAGARLPHGVLDILCPIAATAVILCFFHSVVSRFSRLEDALAWIRKNSLIVLCFHLIDLSLPIRGGIHMMLSLVHLDSYLLAGLLTYLVKVAWGCLAIIVVYRVKPLRYVFSISAS